MASHHNFPGRNYCRSDEKEGVGRDYRVEPAGLQRVATAHWHILRETYIISVENPIYIVVLEGLRWPKSKEL